jgi:hypothetical protein
MAAPLLVIPGPNEPKTLDPYFEGVLTEFANYGPHGWFTELL